MKALIILLPLLLSLNINSQDINYARKILDTLCSESFDGRGFYNNGERRVANFIKSEYKKFGLIPFNQSYFQKFNLSVSSIKGEVKVIIDRKELVPGKDYIVDPSSPSFEGTAPITYLKKKELVSIDNFKNTLRNNNDNFIVINPSIVKNESKKIKDQVQEMIQFLKYAPSIPFKGVIETTDNLTYTASQKVAQRPHIIVLNEKIPFKPKKGIIKIENEFKEDYESQNVIGYIEGKIKDSFICIVGHYDHLGRMGDNIYFPVANDNASGIAMVLSLAKELSKEDWLSSNYYSIFFK